MNSKRFTHINESFTCEYCFKEIFPLVGGGCRNHCPYCLCSKHVDIMPGDRKNLCHGKLEAKAYELNPKKGLVINFICQKCGENGRNKSAVDDPRQPDDYDLILSLSPNS